jgi:hypothetical protein
MRAVLLASKCPNTKPDPALYNCSAGTDNSRVTKLSDEELYYWWLLPNQTEYIFYDNRTSTSPISLWNLGNRCVEHRVCIQTLHCNCSIRFSISIWSILNTSVGW